METIMIFCPHNDDDVFGLGGTILKYLDGGKKIVKIVFSKGEGSHPHLKEKVISDIRKKEAKKVEDHLGIKNVFSFGLTDLKLDKEIEDVEIKEKIKKLIKKFKPDKIYIPSRLDPHPNHRSVNKFIINFLGEIKYKKSLYSYEVWNVINDDKPIVYVDITKYFNKKIELMKKFKSQFFNAFLLMVIPTYLRAWRYGRKNNCKYAERFYKIK
jgi:LmbE family N-acetylglucosaminyl deacetylase